MNTAKALEGMTDPGNFEILAQRVLRLIDEDCKRLAHMGVNAAGKTIRNPLDSFCRVSGTNPPRFVMAEFTTDKNIRQKWLYNHKKSKKNIKATDAKDGDLIKAAQNAETIRKDFPEAIFVVHLCTNRRPDKRIMLETYKMADELRLQVVILEQSGIRDFLDTTPEGHWLRKEHLGIQAELLSLQLLKDLSKKSLSTYENEFFTDPSLFINTTSTETLKQSIQNASKTIHILSGISGIGKSATSYHVLKDHIDNGGIGLWIPGGEIPKAISLEVCIENVLQQLHPNIQRGAGSVALTLARRHNPILLVVDDINRIGDVSGNIRKIVQWGKPIENQEAQNTSTNHYALILPIWERNRHSIENSNNNAPEWVNMMLLSHFSEKEGELYLKRMIDIDLPSIQLRKIAERLDYDPILMAFYTELIKDNAPELYESLTEKVMDNFVEKTISETTCSGSFLDSEYHDAFLELTQMMLRKRELYPLWSQILNWLKESQVNRIREMVSFGKLCRITNIEGVERFMFRHDRILEHFISKALFQMLPYYEKEFECLTDPYYANYLGSTIAKNIIPEEIILWIKKCNPLALISAIRFLSKNDDYSIYLVSIAKDWINGAFKKHNNYTQRITAEACRILEEADSPFVLEITESVYNYHNVLLARFANGDLNSGINYFLSLRYFAPSVTDKYMDLILERAFNSNSSLINELKKILEKEDLEENIRSSALVLAGFTASKELAYAIALSWHFSKTKKEILLPAFWAACRCSFNKASNVMDSMIEFWSSLSDERINGDLSDRDSVSLELKFAIKRGISEPVIQYLLNTAKTNKKLELAILMLLENIDNPNAINFTISVTADRERQAKEENGVWIYGITLRENWDPTFYRGRRLSPDSVNSIQGIWENTKNEDYLRETVFSFWVHAVDDLRLLQSVPPDHKFFEKALWRRVKLGDMSTVPFVEAILSKDSKWFHVINNIWAQGFWVHVDNALCVLREKTPNDFSGGFSNDHYMLAKLLRDIPKLDAERLLLNHWEYLKYSGLFVQLALYIGTEACKKSVEELVESNPDYDNIFKHLGSFFGFFTMGLSDQITITQLEVLKPYIPMLDIHTLMNMAEYCQRYKHHRWALENLKPELYHRRRKNEVNKEQAYIKRMVVKFFPSDNDLINELDELEKNFNTGFLWSWYEEFEKRSDPPDRWLKILRSWFQKAPSFKRLIWVQNAIVHHGRRKDLELLLECSKLVSDDQISDLLEHATFSIRRRTLK